MDEKRPQTNLKNFITALKAKFPNLDIKKDEKTGKVSGRVDKDQKIDIFCEKHKKNLSLSFNDIMHANKNPCEEEQKKEANKLEKQANSVGSNQELIAKRKTEALVAKLFPDRNFEVFPKGSEGKIRLHGIFQAGRPNTELDADIFVKFDDEAAEILGKKGVAIQIDGATHTGNFNNNLFRNDFARGNGDYYLVRINVSGKNYPSEKDSESKTKDQERINQALDNAFVTIKRRLLSYSSGENRHFDKDVKNKYTKKQVEHELKKASIANSEQMLKRLRADLILRQDDSEYYYSFKDGKKHKLSNFLDTSVGHKSFIENKEWMEIAGVDKSSEDMNRWKQEHIVRRGEKLFDVVDGKKRLFENKK